MQVLRPRKLLVTGGAGFIGSALVRDVLACSRERSPERVEFLDEVRCAGHLADADAERYVFVERDICDRQAFGALFRAHEVDAVTHLAAESHVDCSIESADAWYLANQAWRDTVLSEDQRRFQVAHCAEGTG